MQSAKQFLSDPRRVLATAAFAIVVVGVLVIAVVCTAASSSEPSPVTDSPSPSPTQPPTPPPTPAPQEASPLNGVLIDRAEFAQLQQRAPLAVMIENDPAARPQSGFHKADLVYEAVSEGGITRLMAVFWRNEAERIEAIRSARVYYIHWAAELGAVYVHWGQVEDPGPVDVWPVLSRLNMRDLNGLFQGEAVGYRDPNRVAPHNVYSDTGLLWATAQGAGWTGPPTLEPWKFKEDTPWNGAQPGAFNIDIPFTSPGSDFAVRWDYDPASNSYLRSMGGAPHTDGVTGERLTARNIAVQFAVLRPSGIKAYNIIDTVGSGQAVVFRDGIAIPGSWRKDSEAGRTRFYDSAGNEISFNRGPTWIEVVPADSSISY
jgi:DUF3048 family protein